MSIQTLATTVTTATATTTAAPARSLTRYTAPCARVLLGLVFFVCGLDGFLHFLPQPTEAPPEGAMAFGIALMKTGYMFPLIKGTEVAAGALLLASRFVPLALVLIAPVIVNIVAFHAFLAPSGVGLAVVLAVLAIHLAWVHRAAFRPLFVTASRAR